MSSDNLHYTKMKEGDQAKDLLEYYKSLHRTQGEAVARKVARASAVAPAGCPVGLSLGVVAVVGLTISIVMRNSWSLSATAPFFALGSSALLCGLWWRCCDQNSRVHQSAFSLYDKWCSDVEQQGAPLADTDGQVAQLAELAADATHGVV